MAKIEIFPLCIGHSCTTLWVKNSLEIGLSLTVYEKFTFFSFSAKIQDGCQKWRKLKFSPLHRTLLYSPVAQKFARNRSISYGFQDIHTFSLSAKIQDGRQKWRKSKFFPFCIGHSCTALWVKNSFEIALSHTAIFKLFHFPQKFKMAAKSGENRNFSPFA